MQPRRRRASPPWTAEVTGSRTPCFQQGLGLLPHPRHSTEASHTFLASKSGCTRTSAPADVTQSSTRTRLSRVAPILSPVLWSLAPRPLAPHRPSFIPQPAAAGWGSEGTLTPETPAPLCPLCGTIARVSPPAPGVASWSVQRARLSPDSPHAPVCLHLGQGGAWALRGAAERQPGVGCSASGLPPGLWGPQSPHLPA